MLNKRITTIERWTVLTKYYTDVNKVAVNRSKKAVGCGAGKLETNNYTMKLKK